MGRKAVLTLVFKDGTEQEIISHEEGWLTEEELAQNLPELPQQQLPPASDAVSIPKAVDWFITNEPLEIYIGIKGEKVKEDKGIMLNYEDGSKVLLPDADKEKAIAYIDRVIYLLEEAMEELE